MRTWKVGGGKCAFPPPSFRVCMHGYGKTVWFSRLLPEMVFQTWPLEVLYAALVSCGVASSVPLQSQNCTTFPEKQTVSDTEEYQLQPVAERLQDCLSLQRKPMRQDILISLSFSGPLSVSKLLCMRAAIWVGSRNGAHALQLYTKHMRIVP